ncbi:hypothetical protein HMPREF1142_1759 [Peptostreptococcaceae bacterium AS15]|nr:hypothetical protein HMPREF1142_1759 [Peptostreptococcaceae bacterium AS15]
MTDRQKIELIGIRAYRLNKKKSIEPYKLIDIDQWSKEICEELNNSFFEEKYEFKPEENNKFEDKTEELRENFSLIFECYEKKKSNEIKIYMYPDLKTDFVRFDYKIILKKVLDKDDLSKIINDCQESIKKHILLLKIVPKIRAELLKCKEPIKNYSTVKNKLKDLREICAILAFSSGDKKKYSENNIWHELLQNANDHISEEIMEVSIDDSKLCLEYAENEGFTVKDFYAIVTEGNSGNESSLENREGRKGTGFKSVYKYFDKVEISSGSVICELKYDKELTVSIESHELNFQECEYDNYYPIPNFKENEDNSKKTKIILYYKKDTKENILETIFGKKTTNSKDFKQNFEQKIDYLFLENIKKFKFTLDGTTEDVDRCRYIEEHYHTYEECINIENENEVLKSNNFWDKRSKDKPYKDKKKVSILFPKSVDKYSEQKNSVFCTLPIDSSNINLPFYINIPLLELQENRKNISNNHSDNYNFKEWNTTILEAVFKEDGPIYKAFDNLLGDIGDHLYKYFPYRYLKDKLWYDFCIKKFIKKYKFIRTICNKNISYKSINDMEDKHNTFIFLPEFMYEWFNDKDKSQDSNNTSESKLQNFNTAIPFVYYDELKDINEIIKMLRQYYDTNITNITIIDDISKYIQNIAPLYKEKSESEKSEFIKLLHDIEKECNTDNLKEVLCRALLLSMDDYDENITYQCFGNISLAEGKYYEIDGKPSIEKFVDKIRKVFKNISGNYILKAIKNLELSPYLDREQKIKKFKKNSVEKSEIEKIDKKILCYCTEDIIFNHWNDDYITTLKNCVDEGGILYLKSENPIDLSNSIYYTSKNIDNAQVLKIDNNKMENLKKIGIKCLDDAIKNVDFYKDANIGLIESVLKEYKDACLSAIKEYLENTDKSSNNELDKLLLEHYISYIEEYNRPLKWSKKIEKIIDKLEKKTLLNNKLKNAIFDFSNEKLNELPQSLKTKFNNTVSDEEKNKISDFDGLSISELIEKIYLLDCLNKNKSLYCKAKYKEDENKKDENIVVIFNENSFGSLLSSVFDIKSFNQGIKFIDMISGPPNALLDLKDHALLTINEKEEVEKYADKIYKQYKDKLLNHFIQYWDIPIWGSEKKWINAQGYGNYEYKDKTCPLCGSILIAESSLLKIGYLSYTKKVDLDNKNYNLPFPMCPNCFKSFKYTDQVCLSLDCNKPIEDYLALDDIKMQEIDVCFDMYASKKKFIEKVKLSFFTRHIWNIILKS